jgi:hypothetical protein
VPSYAPGQPATFITFPMALSPFGVPIGSITVGDPEQHNPIKVTLQVGNNNGTVSLATTNGLTITPGDGVNDGIVNMVGSTESINAALDGLVFIPLVGYTGPSRLVVTVNDLARGTTGRQTQCTIHLSIVAAPAAKSASADSPPPSSASPAPRHGATTSGDQPGGSRVNPSVR